MHKLISVVLPVFNGDKYLSEAIESILNQTYINFEFIIINDGSTDNSLTIIENYRVKDNRIVVISQENKGLIASLNEGIRIANGSYIARMDADDISLPGRFEEQIGFMEENSLDICGTSIQLFNEKQEYSIWNYPKEDKDIKFLLMFMSTFAHPSVLMKKEIFNALKYQEFKHAEDYKLWTDIALSGFRMGNLNKVLLKYRYHSEQTSKKNNYEQRTRAFEISQTYLNAINDETQNIALKIRKITATSTPKLLNELLKDIKTYSTKSNVCNEVSLNVIRALVRVASPTNFKMFLVYRDNTKDMSKDFKGELYILIQSLLMINRESKAYQFLKRYI